MSASSCRCACFAFLDTRRPSRAFGMFCDFFAFARVVVERVWGARLCLAGNWEWSLILLRDDRFTLRRWCSKKLWTTSISIT